MKQEAPSQLSTADRPPSMESFPEEIQNAFVAQMHFGFEIQTNFIIDLFEEIAQQSQFEMIEREANHATVIKQVKKTFLQMIDCFNWVSEGNMTAIKLTIQTNEKASKRVCRIRGLVGSKKEVRHIIKEFKVRSKKMVKTQNSFYPSEIEDESNENIQNPFHLQACAMYMFHKILSNEQYGVGSILKKSLSGYRNRFSNVQSSSKELPLPMKNCIALVQEIVDQLYKDFNYGKKQMEKVMPYCRVSVEKYIFTQVESVTSPIYSLAYSELDSKFSEKRSRIFSTKTLRQILQEAGLADGLWFIEKGTNLDEIHLFDEWRHKVKYAKGCEELEKIALSKTPRQKIKHCQLTYICLKTIFYEESDKKRELTNMEQIIPIFIVVLLLSNINSLKSELQLIKDFVQNDPCDMESEKRLLLNLTESLNFICRDWKV